ncbi:MAG: hypothetical protein K2F91_07670 [Muribaculaceae bacterium]|nr:hypothetical protein [Muribaculaceae bacterium]
MSRRSFFVLMLVLALPYLVSRAAYRRPQPPRIAPVIPTADRTAGNRVFLERAGRLFKHTGDSFMILVDTVVFTKGPMIMRCDSAHYYAETESMDAFGNVSMEQGDTLFVYADELRYDGLEEVATLYADPGKKVRLINRDVMLQTDVFIYNLAYDLGYFEVGGRLTDPSNTLTSLYGEYAPSTKEANFYTDVHLNSRNSTDTLDIYSDTLYYNTATHVAELLSPSTVINARGTIYTSLGVYDTDSNRTTLFNRSLIVTSQGQTLTADTIFYDRTAGYGEAFGGMILTDTAHSVELHADYGFYNELTDSSFATGRATVLEYSEEDTLYMHGRYVQSFLAFDTVEVAADTIAGTEAYTRVDTSHVAVLYPRVRFYRADMQGVCDSMRFTEADTMLRMFVNPVVWNQDQQVFGNVIELELNDSTIEKAILPDQAFTAQHIEGEHYNQMSGKEMIAYFTDGQMRRLDINGNVEIIMYPEESDSTINKIVNAESSFLTARFKGRTTESIKTWPQTTGTATPLFLAKKSLYKLPKFQWFGDMRPMSPDDIYNVPESMEQRMLESGHPIPPEPPRRLSPLHQRPDGKEPEPQDTVPQP